MRSVYGVVRVEELGVQKTSRNVRLVKNESSKMPGEVQREKRGMYVKAYAGKTGIYASRAGTEHDHTPTGARELRYTATPFRIRTERTKIAAQQQCEVNHMVLHYQVYHECYASDSAAKVDSPRFLARSPAGPPACYPGLVQKLRDLRRLPATGFSDNHDRLPREDETPRSARVKSNKNPQIRSHEHEKNQQFHEVQDVPDGEPVIREVCVAVLTGRQKQSISVDLSNVASTATPLFVDHIVGTDHFEQPIDSSDLTWCSFTAPTMPALCAKIGSPLLCS